MPEILVWKIVRYFNFEKVFGGSIWNIFCHNGLLILLFVLATMLNLSQWSNKTFVVWNDSTESGVVSVNPADEDTSGTLGIVKETSEVGPCRILSSPCDTVAMYCLLFLYIVTGQLLVYLDNTAS